MNSTAQQLIRNPHCYWVQPYQKEQEQNLLGINPPGRFQGRIFCILCNEEEPASFYEHIHCQALYHLQCLNDHTNQTRATDCSFCHQPIEIPKRYYVAAWIAFVVTTIAMQESAIGLKYLLGLKKPNLSLLLAGTSSALILKNSYDLVKMKGPCQHGLIIPMGAMIALFSSLAITSFHTIQEASFELSLGIAYAIPILSLLSDNTPLSHVQLSAASMALLFPLFLEIGRDEGTYYENPQYSLLFFELMMSAFVYGLYCKPSYIKNQNHNP